MFLSLSGVTIGILLRVPLPTWRRKAVSNAHVIRGELSPPSQLRRETGGKRLAEKGLHFIWGCFEQVS